MKASSENMAKDKVKILLVVTSTAGGAGLQTYYLAKYLPSSEFDLTVAFGPGYPLDAEFEKLGIPIVHLSLSRKISPLKNIRGFFELYSLIRRHRFQIVCMGCSIAGFIGRIASYVAGVPFRVFVIHAYASRPHQPNLKRGLFFLVEKFLDCLTTHYIAVSDATKRFGVSQGIMREEKVRVIHNGIMLDDKRTKEGNSIREELGLHDHIPVVGVIGRLETQKGIAYFIRAAVLAKKEVPEAEFLVVGSGPLHNELQSLAVNLGAIGYVKFVGWRDDIPRILGCMDIVCLPSLWEQFPLSVLEALSMERPVVAAAVDGVPEVVLHQKTGLLVPPADPEKLASGVVTLLRNPGLAGDMGREGRKLVESKFSVVQMAGHYRDFFLSLGYRAHDLP